MSIAFGWLGEVENSKINDYLEAIEHKLSTNLFGCRKQNGGLFSSSENSNNFYQIKDVQLCILGEVYDLELEPDCKLSAKQVLEIFLRRGSKCFKSFSGSYIISIFAERQNSLWIVPDKLGSYPLYFTKVNQRLFYSNQLSAMQLNPLFNAEISPDAIYHYLYFHFIPSPISMYKHIQRLQPGEYLIFDGNQVKILPYVSYQYATNNDSFKDKRYQLKNLVGKSVNLYCEQQTPGVFLSGGIDSTSVLGVLTQFRNFPIKSFTIGFDAKGYDEVEFAEYAAKQYRSDHHVYYLTPQDIVDTVPKLCQSLGQPFGNASILPTYFCAKLAKENGVNCLFAGDGGDELFGGNERYQKQKIFETYLNLPKFVRTKLIENFVDHSWLLKNTPLISKAKSFIEQANAGLPDRLFTYNLLSRFNLSEVFNDRFYRQINPGQPLNLYKTCYQQADCTSINRLLNIELKFTLSDNDLVKVRTACEMANISVKFPLLFDPLVQFAVGLKTEDKVTISKLRPFFKSAMADYLPRNVINKSKHGFGSPFGVWLKTNKNLQEFAFDNVNSLKNRNIISSRFIDELINKFNNSHPSYYGVMIWLFLILEQWLTNHEQAIFSKPRQTTQKNREQFAESSAV